MSDTRKQILSRVIQEAELQKLAQQTVDSVQEGTSQEGELLADQIFDKLLEGIQNEIESTQ